MSGAAEARVASLEAALRELVESLPKCDVHPDRPATKAFDRGGKRYCDDCGADVRKTLKPGEVAYPLEPYNDDRTGERLYRPRTSYEAPDYPRAAAVRRALALLSEETTR